MAAVKAENYLHGQITCGSLLQQLQQIWDEVGEGDEERDQMLLQIEQECLDVYKKKVDQAVKSRAQLLHSLANARVELTNLLSALGEETYIGIAAVEVERLDQLKASRMKEIAFKRQAELEDIFSGAHIEIDAEAAREKILALIEGNIEPVELLAEMDNQIIKAKGEALSRKDILEKVEKWMSACEEERWPEDYNRDENRYSSGRGSHLNLKRAEKARILVNKIPGHISHKPLDSRDETPYRTVNLYFLLRSCRKKWKILDLLTF